ncbi:MAG: serine/threonine protein kinase [Chloroflexi bacterium]|jgi:serine/threonine protein kinase|nr:serine/threonine protein kinase [Chloroflexota bacterium]
MVYAPGDQIGGYQLVRRLGQGGMGVVFEARGPEGERVVLKIPHLQLLEEAGARARYDRELEVTRLLDHPNVQRVVATGEVARGRMPYLALEWIDGGLLRDHLHEGSPVTVDEAITYAIQLCDALAYCHDQGIVHRDLKPDNIMIGRDGRIRLIDFGASLLEGAPRITTSSISPALGTPDYMSPEQVQGKRGDVRSDVYALGAMLYELLTGYPPYRGDTALAVMAQHVQSSPPPFRARVRGVPAALEAITFKAMRRNPDARYQSMGAMRSDLTRVGTLDATSIWAEAPNEGPGSPVAGGPGPGQKAPIWVPWTIAALAVAVAVAALGAVVALER